MITVPTVTNIYINILDQVLAIELCKKEISKKILLLKPGKRRLNFIHSFLGYDLNKHELLEHAAVIALHNDEQDILERISQFYYYREEEDLLSHIRKEIRLNSVLMETIKKQLNNHNLTFVEKRMLKEITKYVLEQAREYMKKGK